ncbi:hypothetical protein RHMOL_Rhmol10G0124700 [Rhododendron molle]|uniref:Uncharacterized protein n=1 Tax=Rhododendron molle TaxID=49168 RepID=A0ACC0M1P6_RHOML|nr:hypothetical protein RHMOL_Rhmol10G0124700 [Rhododendron molle]
MKESTKSKGVTMRNLHIRLAMIKSSILCSVLGLNMNSGCSNTCKSSKRGTLVSSILAARDKQATDSSYHCHCFPSCTETLFVNPFRWY